MKCYKCIFYGIYRDMGASCPVCTLEIDLTQAVRRIKEQETTDFVCFYYYTKDMLKAHLDSKLKQIKEMENN